jgi:hypothetical protein
MLTIGAQAGSGRPPRRLEAVAPADPAAMDETT